MTFEELYIHRINKFRRIEASIISGKSKDNSCQKAFSFLRDMEKCYAIQAYYACLIIACASIEACLNHELGNEGNLKAKLENSGYSDQGDWLRCLRNEIVHKNESDFVGYYISSERELELDALCKKAFILVHTIYFESTVAENA